MIVAALMSAFLVAMIADHHIRRSTGTDVILDLEPVDPRDLLAGYYVIISTPVHRIQYDSVEGDRDFSAHDDVFVSIEPESDGSWSPVSIHRTRPANGVYLHGKVQTASTDGITAHFNIERFYADETTAQALDQRRFSDRDSMRLIVSVGNDGRAIIRGLEIEGERQIAPLL
jgi:uncharacterized membrane-anchored protein